VDREKVREYLAGLNSVENAYVGVTGKTYFDANGDCLKAAFVKEIREGSWVSAKEQLG
jgi:branched-chain amino acid transport system substrate-binding protein